MNNNYLVIKLPGSWIEQEQMRKRVKAFLGVDVLEEDVVTYRCQQLIDEIPKESSVRCEDFLKEKMAETLGRQLLEKGLFRIDKKPFRFGTSILEGKITIIDERAKGGDT